MYEIWACREQRRMHLTHRNCSVMEKIDDDFANGVHCIRLKADVVKEGERVFMCSARVYVYMCCVYSAATSQSLVQCTIDR